MLGYYSYLLSLLLITHWTTNCASLRSSVDLSEEVNRDSSRRNQQHFNSQIPLIKRLKRWVKAAENDEIEIPLNETNLSVNSTDETPFNSTLFNSEAIDSNASISETFDNSTSSLQLNMTAVEVLDTNETTTMAYRLLRHDLIDDQSNDTLTAENALLNVSLSSVESSEWTSTDRERSSTSAMDTDQVTINESTTESIDRSFNESHAYSAPILHNQTDSTMTSNLSDSTTIFEENLADNDSLIHSNLTLKNSILIDQETYLNNTDTIVIDTNVSSTSVTRPLCDQSCQCRQECSYGFELVNDTCLCTPPCQNYRCFGNDTCTVTDEGQRLCRPENSTEHDRPTRCYQPRDSGFHDVNMRYHNRWYYNPDQDMCHLFVYRGLGGNENNFRTLHECHLECITCAPLPDPGECLGRINMWAYDNKKNECIQFDYSGCKGNENKFLKKEICVNTCIRRILNVK